MKKLGLFLVFGIMSLVGLVGEVLASGNPGAVETINNFIAGYGGWFPVIAILVSFAIIFIIRATETKKDDEALDSYIAPAMQFFLDKMPKNVKINFIKALGNAMGHFMASYIKEKGIPPKASLIKKAEVVFGALIEQKIDEQNSSGNSAG